MMLFLNSSIQSCVDGHSSGLRFLNVNCDDVEIRQQFPLQSDGKVHLDCLCHRFRSASFGSEPCRN